MRQPTPKTDVVRPRPIFLYPANIYLFKFNNRNTRKKCEISSKITISTTERHQWPGCLEDPENFEMTLMDSDGVFHVF